MDEKEVIKLKHNFARAYLLIKIQSTDAARGSIQAVHLAIDLSDLIVWDTVIADYLTANERAIHRGVEVARIFVLEKTLTYLSNSDKILHPEICRILDEQMQIGICVRILWQDTIRAKKLTEPADLIIFDSNEVHLHKGHGGWYPEVQIVTDHDEIAVWRKQYSQWMEFSIPWETMKINYSENQA
jgi:hypothetical protein